MPTYLDSSLLSQDPATAGMPVLRIAPNQPVQVTMPARASASGGGGGGGLDTAALGKKIAGLLQQKYGSGPVNPNFDQAYADQTAQSMGYTDYAAATKAGAL